MKDQVKERYENFSPGRMPKDPPPKSPGMSLTPCRKPNPNTMTITARAKKHKGMSIYFQSRHKLTKDFTAKQKSAGAMLPPRITRSTTAQLSRQKPDDPDNLNPLTNLEEPTLSPASTRKKLANSSGL